MAGSELEQAVRRFGVRRAADPCALTNTPLPPLNKPGRAQLVAELVRADLAYGWGQGRPQPLSGYLIDYPELLGDRESLESLAREEFRLRSEAGQCPDPAEYRRHFGVAVGSGDAVLDSLTVRLPDAADTVRGLAAFPRAGDEFAGFRIEGELGRGSFARVYLARQSGLAGRPVVLKVSAAPSVESQTLAQLQHTNIVPVYSVHEADGLYAVCMPYFGSATLADISGALSRSPGLPGSGRYIVSALASHRPASSRPASAAAPAGAELALPQSPAAGADEAIGRLAKASYVEAVLWLMARLADGLGHAHARGVVHRDLKPANILLTSDGQPMLLDFNLAEVGPSDGRAGGTIPYMAPEHLLAFEGRPGGAADARSDLYSLGLIAYELLAGRPPFVTPTGSAAVAVPQMVAARLAGAPDVRAANPAVSPAAAAIVAKCLAPLAGDRYQSAVALRDDIDAHLAHRPLAIAANPSLGENARKWFRRHPRAASAYSVGGAALVALAAVALLGLAAHGRAADAAAREQALALAAARDQFEFDYGVGVARTEDLAAAVPAGQALLAPYGVFDDPRWLDRPAVARLAGPDRAALVRSVRGVLFLMRRAAELTDSPRAAELADALRSIPQPESGGRREEAEALAARAVPLLDAGDEAAARPLLDRAAALAPDWLPARLARGVGLCYQSEYGAAVAEFDICLALDPGNKAALANRASAYRNLKLWAKAVADFGELAAAWPGEPDWLVARGTCKLRLGDDAGALADYTAAAQTSRPPSRAYLYRSRVLAKLGRAAEAGADMAHFYREPPTDATDFRLRGMIRAKSDPAGAAADLRASLARDPGQVDVATALAAVLSGQLGRPDEAVAVLDRVPAARQTGGFLANRAVVRARAGDRAGGHRDAEAALRVPHKPFSTYQVACAYALTARQAPADKSVALKYLAEALSAGGPLADKAAADPDLVALRGDPHFRALLQAARTR